MDISPQYVSLKESWLIVKQSGVCTTSPYKKK